MADWVIHRLYNRLRVHGVWDAGLLCYFFAQMKSKRDKYFLEILDLKLQLQDAKNLVAHLWGHVHEASVPLSTRQKVEAILKGRK